MKTARRTLVLLSLILFAACSGRDRLTELKPPEDLLTPEAPLILPAVETNRDLVRRSQIAESRYRKLLARFNALLCWYEISPLDENGQATISCVGEE